MPTPKPGRVFLGELEAELRELERTDPRVRAAARRYEQVCDDVLTGYAGNVASFRDRLHARLERENA